MASGPWRDAFRALGVIHVQLRALADVGRSPPPRATDPEEALEMAEDTAEFFEQRSWVLAVTLRDATMCCSTTFVVPKPVEDLIDLCGELFMLRRWWLAVRSGERDILDGPPPDER